MHAKHLLKCVHIYLFVWTGVGVLCRQVQSIKCHTHSALFFKWVCWFHIFCSMIDSFIFEVNKKIIDRQTYKFYCAFRTELIQLNALISTIQTIFILKKRKHFVTYRLKCGKLYRMLWIWVHNRYWESERERADDLTGRRYIVKMLIKTTQTLGQNSFRNSDQF